MYCKLQDNKKRTWNFYQQAFPMHLIIITQQTYLVYSWIIDFPFYFFFGEVQSSSFNLNHNNVKMVQRAIFTFFVKSIWLPEPIILMMINLQRIDEKFHFAHAQFRNHSIDTCRITVLVSCMQGWFHNSSNIKVLRNVWKFKTWKFIRYIDGLRPNCWFFKNLIEKAIFICINILKKEQAWWSLLSPSSPLFFCSQSSFLFELVLLWTGASLVGFS